MKDIVFKVVRKKGRLTSENGFVQQRLTIEILYPKKERLDVYCTDNKSHKNLSKLEEILGECGEDVIIQGRLFEGNKKYLNMPFHPIDREVVDRIKRIIKSLESWAEGHYYQIRISYGETWIDVLLINAGEKATKIEIKIYYIKKPETKVFVNERGWKEIEKYIGWDIINFLHRMYHKELKKYVKKVRQLAIDFYL